MKINMRVRFDVAEFIGCNVLGGKVVARIFG